MGKIFTSLSSLAFLAFFSSIPLQANIPVVSWGLSPNYLNDNANGLGLSFEIDTVPLGPDSLSTGFRARYLNETQVTSLTYWVAPDSPNFGIAAVHANGIGSEGPANLQVRLEGRPSVSPAGDAIQIGATTATSSYGASLIWWRKDEFLGGFTAAPLSSSGTSITVRSNISSHILIKNGNDWFISETALAGIGINDTTTASRTINLTSQNWASYDPTGDTFFSLFANPATTDNLPDPITGLTFSPQTFDDIQSIGIYTERIGSTENRMLFLSEFNVVAIPEPTTYGLILSFLLFIGVLYHRLKK